MKFNRLVRDTAVFAPCYVVLDWASYIDPLGPFNITPWSPQAALAVAWMVLAGLANAPIVLVTILLADVLVRDTPGGLGIVALTASVLTAGYAGVAFTLRRLLDGTGLRTTRQLTIFSLVAVAGASLISAAFVGTLHYAGQIPAGGFPDAWLRFWIGDAVGILVTTPLLFAAADSDRRADLVSLTRRPEALLQVVALAATVWLIFRGFGNDPSRQFYLLFLPLIWIAVRFGLTGAIVAIGIVQMAVVVGIHGSGGTPLPVLELQALIAALTLTGLFLGVTVDQRQAAERDLRESLRLAAAGEMAGAIAHEVNQPLTAVSNYASSARTILSRVPVDVPRAEEVVSRIQSEAERAGEVVRRLRDFFRTGTTRLAEVTSAELVAIAQRLGEAATSDTEIRFELVAPKELPALLVDRLQIEVVIRNLIDNAVESVLNAGVPEGRLDVRLEPLRNCLRIVVCDNGPGLRRGERGNAFTPFVSGKPTGMGLGLAVSRAIAEAHGGSLNVVAATHGEFHLSIPWASQS